MKRPLIFGGLIIGLLTLAPSSQAQSFLGKPEGSRPGETYHTGNQQPEPPPRQQMNPNLSREQLHQQSTDKSKAGEQLVIMEFSDLQCPDSARFNRELKNTILQRYVSTGKASYEWHDFPLPSHSDAPAAAAAARCAGASADAMRQQIMSNQGQMSNNVYVGYARRMGLDNNRYGTCLREGSSMREVMNDQALGKSFGVRGTPTLAVCVKKPSGQVQPVKIIKAYDPPQQVLAELDSALTSH